MYHCITHIRVRVGVGVGVRVGVRVGARVGLGLNLMSIRHSPNTCLLLTMVYQLYQLWYPGSMAITVCP